MSPYVRTFVIWGPRVIGLAATLFMGLFALDAFDGRPLSQALPDFVIHLIPATIVGLAVAIAWRYPLAGAMAFGALAIGYTVMVQSRPDWILSISVPLALVAVMFAISAAIGRNPPREATPAS
jgi:CHASE2 domain-containing sensor protein